MTGVAVFAYIEMFLFYSFKDFLKKVGRDCWQEACYHKMTQTFSRGLMMEERGDSKCLVHVMQTHVFPGYFYYFLFQHPKPIIYPLLLPYPR